MKTNQSISLVVTDAWDLEPTSRKTLCYQKLHHSFKKKLELCDYMLQERNILE